MSKLEKVVIEKSKNLFTTKYKEKGDTIWDKNDGIKRKQIIEEVGLEYKQINLIAEVLFEIVKADTDLQNNEVIKAALEKFQKINEIRNS